MGNHLHRGGHADTRPTGGHGVAGGLVGHVAQILFRNVGVDDQRARLNNGKKYGVSHYLAAGAQLGLQRFHARPAAFLEFAEIHNAIAGRNQLHQRGIFF